MENPATWESYKLHVHGARPLGSAESLTNNHGQRRSKEWSNQEFCGSMALFFPREVLRGKFLNLQRYTNTYGSIREPDRTATTP